MGKKRMKDRFDKNGNFSYFGQVKYLIVTLVVCIGLLILCPFKIVGPTERGIVKTFGEAGNTVLEPGWKIKIMIVRIITGIIIVAILAVIFFTELLFEKNKKKDKIII